MGLILLERLPHHYQQLLADQHMEYESKEQLHMHSHVLRYLVGGSQTDIHTDKGSLFTGLVIE